MDSPMYRCAYDNTNCYKAKAVAVIYDITESQGYLTGGQEITVKGHGFANGTIDAKIDGVPCKVFYQDLSQFKCITGAQPTPSNGSYFLGQHGLRRKLINSTYSVSLTNITASTEYTEMLALDFETPWNVKSSNYGNIFSGYFKAPATA